MCDILVRILIITMDSGYRLKARDVTLAGVATHFIPRAQVWNIPMPLLCMLDSHSHIQIPTLKEHLSELCSSNGKLPSSNPMTIIKQELDSLHQKVRASIYIHFIFLVYMHN